MIERGQLDQAQQLALVQLDAAGLSIERGQLDQVQQLDATTATGQAQHQRQQLSTPQALQ